MQIQEDIKAARKSVVQAFRTQQKKVSENYDGITVSAYIEKYKKDPRANNEAITMEWYEGVFQECVLWRKKAKGQFDLSVGCSISTLNNTQIKILKHENFQHTKITNCICCAIFLFAEQVFIAWPRRFLHGPGGSYGSDGFSTVQRLHVFKFSLQHD